MVARYFFLLSNSARYYFQLTAVGPAQYFFGICITSHQKSNGPPLKEMHSLEFKQKTLTNLPIIVIFPLLLDDDAIAMNRVKKKYFFATFLF